MLRTVSLALGLGLLAACSSQISDDPVGLPVRGDNGVMLGQVTAVERDAEGRVIAVEIPGLEPADAPATSQDMLAENDDFWVQTSFSEPASGAGSSALR